MVIDGSHVTCDMYGCEFDMFNNEAMVEALQTAAKKSGATILDTHSVEFKPYGLSVSIILAESHATIHTFPEEKQACFDCFTCGTTADPTIACGYIVNFLKPSHFEQHIIKRGKEHLPKSYLK